MGANFKFYRAGEREFSELDKEHEYYRGELMTEYEYPHSGTFAAKGRGLILQKGIWSAELAEEHCVDKNNKWDSAYAYKLEDGWLVGGWCPE